MTGEPRARSKPRVLVVDDLEDMALMLAEVLGESGYEVVATSSGRSAVERLRQERFDAVVTDLRMPDVDGFTVLAISQELDPTRPVIVMTGHAGLETAIAASNRGAYRYIPKPFRVGVLEAVLEQALGDGTKSGA